MENSAYHLYVRHSNKEYMETYLVMVLTKKALIITFGIVTSGKTRFHISLNCEISRGLPGQFVGPSLYISYTFWTVRQAGSSLRLTSSITFARELTRSENHSSASIDRFVVRSIQVRAWMGLFNPRLSLAAFHM